MEGHEGGEIRFNTAVTAQYRAVRAQAKVAAVRMEGKGCVL